MTRRSKPTGRLVLSDGESIDAVKAEPASGPGWANSPLWVYIRSRDGSIRVECLQPDEQPDEVLLLYGIAASVHGLMLKAINRAYRVERCS